MEEKSFTPINTQEEFDNRIKDRLARETAKYADYERIKQENDTYKQQIAAVNEKVTGYDEQIKSLNSKIKGYESDSVKTRIALELGLPHALANRLTGDDEAAIRKDAENIMKLIGPSAPAPTADRENTKEKTENAAYLELLKKLEK